MNLSILQQICYDRLEYDSATVAAAVTTRLTGYINEAQRWILTQKGCSSMRRMVLPFVCVANQPMVSLPQPVSKIWTIQDRANLKLLDEISLLDLRTSDPGLTTSSSFPYAYVLHNVAAVTEREPAAACALAFNSTNAADTAPKRVNVEGYTNTGEYFSESVNLNGVTAVTTTRNTILSVTRFTMSSAAALSSATGIISMFENGTGSNLLSRIFAGRSSARYTRIQLYPTPTIANTYFADVDLRIEDMSALYDEPYVHEDFHWILASYALMREFRRRRWDADYEAERALFTSGLRDLKVRLAQMTGAVNADQRRQRLSQLGPFFPAGT
jgi:hypothetical protein